MFGFNPLQMETRVGWAPGAGKKVPEAEGTTCDRGKGVESPVNILIVDDDEVYRTRLCRGFELRGWQIDAVVQHRAEEFPKGLRVTLRGRRPVAYWPRREEPSEHRTDPVGADRYSRFFRSRGNSLYYLRAGLFQPWVDFFALLAKDSQHRNARRHRQWIP